jgi:hypothetical protein
MQAPQMGAPLDAMILDSTKMGGNGMTRPMPAPMPQQIPMNSMGARPELAGIGLNGIPGGNSMSRPMPQQFGGFGGYRPQPFGGGFGGFGNPWGGGFGGGFGGGCGH